MSVFRCSSSSCGNCQYLSDGTNQFEHLSDGTTVIWLDRRDGSRFACIIDTSDHALVKDQRWYAQKNGQTFYAGTNNKTLMHQLFGDRLDHIDHNGLNNRRNNLRPATRSQNNYNRQKQSRLASSVYKGVFLRKRSGRFEALIGIKGKRIYLGSFDSEIDAARVYNKAALEHFGEFAVLNEIDESRRSDADANGTTVVKNQNPVSGSEDGAGVKRAAGAVQTPPSFFRSTQ